MSLLNSSRYEALFEQMADQSEELRASAQKVLSILFQRYQPKSVLDLGCGTGAWLAVAREMGAQVIQGVDGDWLDESRLVIEPGHVIRSNLEHPLNLGRQFDLAICLETAEHLSPAAADTLVQNLVAHAPVILFSAAIPLQRGPGHVNEQWPFYWAEKFRKFRFGSLDFIRCQIWYDPDVLWWYRQNVLLYVNYDWCKTQPALWREGEIENARPRPMNLVLPEFFATIASRLQKIEDALIKGGRYSLEVDDHRMIRLWNDKSDLRTNGHPHVTISAPTAASKSQ
jgi:SAM-dependent methyltransferase